MGWDPEALPEALRARGWTVVAEHWSAPTSGRLALTAPPDASLAGCSVALRFVGEAVAIIVADTPEIARDAAELVELDLDDLDVSLGLAPGDSVFGSAMNFRPESSSASTVSGHLRKGSGGFACRSNACNAATNARTSADANLCESAASIRRT